MALFESAQELDLDSVAKRRKLNIENGTELFTQLGMTDSRALMQEGKLLPPAIEAVTDEQRKSLAELLEAKKYSLYESVCEDDRSNYFRVSCRPITKKAEDDMELLSDLVSWGEKYLHHWERGQYNCSKCSRPLYSSKDKWKGPCVWPSFRKPISEGSISTTEVRPYNNYTVTVKEVYCGGCDLFIGHQFEDGIVKGDRHPEAHWRH